VQLLVLPVLAWTRFAIASGAIAGELQTPSRPPAAHLLAKDARLALAPSLFSIDQLPRSTPTSSR
jgi:hypothetical protein